MSMNVDVGLVVQIVLAVVAMAAAGVAVNQASSAKVQADAAEKQADAARDQVAAAKDQVAEMKRANELVATDQDRRRALELEHRDFRWVVQWGRHTRKYLPDNTPEDQERVPAVFVENRGQTKAVNVEVMVDVLEPAPTMTGMHQRFDFVWKGEPGWFVPMSMLHQLAGPEEPVRIIVSILWESEAGHRDRLTTAEFVTTVNGPFGQVHPEVRLEIPTLGP